MSDEFLSDETVSVPFTRFYSPSGRQEPDTISLPKKVESKVKEIQDAGCRLTAEILSTGICSFCIEHKEGDFDCRLVPNGPEVPVEITKMILAFHLTDFQEWLDAMTHE